MWLFYFFPYYFGVFWILAELILTTCLTMFALLVITLLRSLPVWKGILQWLHIFAYSAPTRFPVILPGLHICIQRYVKCVLVVISSDLGRKVCMYSEGLVISP